MSQSLFKAGEDRLVVATFEVDEPIGFQAGLRQRGREQVRAGDAPEHFAARPCSDASHKTCGRGPIDGAIPPARDLMQRATREPTARKPRVHHGDTEGQHRYSAPTPAFELLDLGAQGLEGGRRPHDWR